MCGQHLWHVLPELFWFESVSWINVEHRDATAMPALVSVGADQMSDKQRPCEQDAVLMSTMWWCPGGMLCMQEGNFECMKSLN